MKNVADFLIKTVGFLIVVFLAVAVGYAFSEVAHKYPDPFKQEPKPKMFVEKFMELQVEAGCTQIDAKVGPEVKEKFNAKAELELPEYFNKQAAPFHTASGAPKGE